MRLTLLVLILFKSVIAEDDSDERYIDNLPEEEKREFLEKIARRILEDYQNINIPKAPTVNISDEALNTHTAYVQNILKQERNKTNKAIIRRDNKDTSKSKENENERKNSDNEKFLDLTMRASKREKRRNIQNENHTNIDLLIPVVPLYDNLDLSEPHKNHVQVSESVVEKTATDKQFDDNYEKRSKSLRHSFIYDDSEDSDERKSTIIVNFKPDLSEKKESLSDGTVENHSKSTSENVAITSTTTDKVINLRKNNNVDESMSENPIDNETIEFKSVEKFSKINDSFELDTNKTITKDNSETTFKPYSLTFNEHIQDIIKDNPALVTSNPLLDGLGSLKTNTSIGNSAINFTFSNSNITEKDLYTTTEANKISDLKTESYITVAASTKNSSLDVTINNFKQLVQSKVNISYRARKTYPQQHIQEDRTFIKNVKSINSWKSGSRENKSVYYVYEVSAERPPFVATKDNEDDENPHYAPVYNYSPENAYYNPYNRFGPNEIDMDSGDTQDELRDIKKLVKPSKRSRFKNINSDYYNPYKLNLYNILKHKNPYNMMDPQPVVPNSDNYNPNDYIDMDYFFGRNENYMRKGKFNPNNLPDTNESDHPYTNYQEGNTINYMDAVRKLLFANQMFGYVPSVNEKRQTKTLRDNLHDIFHIDYNKDKDDIAMDYYFGRQNSHEERDIFNYQLQKFQQFHPVTPTPIKRKKLKTNELVDAKEIDIVESTLDVLQDFIKMDNEALKNYDWLRGAVDVQSALEKLYELTESLKASENLHPYDLELLKYAIYLYKSSNLVLNDTISLTSLNELRKNRKKISLVPKINKKKKGYKSAVKMWRDFATFLRSLIQGKKELLYQFQRFLIEVQFFLIDLHDAIKHVAMVTTYKSQNWYTDLKNLYFRHADRRKLLTILLHLSVSRLFGLIEDTKDILDESFLSFVKKNKQEVAKARNECTYILKLLNELRKINKFL